MTDSSFQLARFVFFFLSASFASLFVLLFLRFARYKFRALRLKNLEKKYGYELKNYLFSISRTEHLPWLKAKGKNSRKALEELLLKQLFETGFSGAPYKKLIYLWESNGFPDENMKKLRSRREGDRVRGCLALGYFKHDPARRQIRDLLQDPSEKVRWAATFSLFGLRDERSLPRILESVSHSGRFSLIQLQYDLFELSREGVFSLEEALQHPEADVRILALGIVGRLGQIDFIRFISKLLEDPVLDVRMKALAALIDLANENILRQSHISDKKADARVVKLPAELESVLSERLEQGTWEETARILQVIGSWKLAKFFPEIENQVTHLHPWVRYRALETLLQLGPEGRRRANAILSEHRHIVFPILEDLDVKNDIQE